VQFGFLLAVARVEMIFGLPRVGNLRIQAGKGQRMPRSRGSPDCVLCWWITVQRRTYLY